MILYHNPRKTSIATIAAMDEDGLIYAEHSDETINAEKFIGFIQNLVQVVAGEAHLDVPSMPQDTILVIDNARAHTALETYKHCWQQKVKVLTTPAYSPEVQPVEKLFLSLKKKNAAKMAKMR